MESPSVIRIGNCLINPKQHIKRMLTMIQRVFTRHSVLMVTVFSATLLTGCGSSKQPPTEKMATAESYINTARESEARDLVELRRAEDKLSQAKTAVAEEEYEVAERLADQALIDARLAEAKAESNAARQATEDLRDSINTLRREVNR